MSTDTQDAPALAGASDSVARDAVRDDLVLGGAAVTMGLLAGFFYSYACSVMPGLHGSTDRTVVDAMQHINRSVENPAFFATFLGAPALVAWALAIERRRGSPVVARWLAASAALVGVGLLVTFAFNIPLNNELEQAGDPSTIANIAKVRDDFETPWVIWNVVRTLAVAGSFACLTRALFIRRRGAR